MNSEIKLQPIMKDQERIIYTSALLHDMCDNKYMDEQYGLDRIREFITISLNYDRKEVETICKIISTMSYSKVKKNGFPNMGEYQSAYHIVREADLLTAYDIDRCIVYNMNCCNEEYIQSITDACNLYEVRMGKHIKDNLFVTSTGLSIARELETDANLRFKELKNIIT